MTYEKTYENAQTPERGQDPIDQLLNDAFEKALDVSGGTDLVEVTMARIAGEQRRRAIVFALIGVVAAVIAAVIAQLTSLPLLALIQTFISELATASGLTGGIGETTGWQSNLPVLVLAIGVAAGGVWLLLEEAL